MAAQNLMVHVLRRQAHCITIAVNPRIFSEIKGLRLFLYERKTMFDNRDNSIRFEFLCAISIIFLDTLFWELYTLM